MSSISGEKNKIIRSALLGLLRTEYPGSLDLKVLSFSLDSLGFPMPEATLKAHLKYLSEKGLVKLAARKGYGFRFVYASLTARGWDLLDGNVTEDGVSIPKSHGFLEPVEGGDGASENGR